MLCSFYCRLLEMTRLGCHVHFCLDDVDIRKSSISFTNIREGKWVNWIICLMDVPLFLLLLLLCCCFMFMWIMFVDCIIDVCVWIIDFAYLLDMDKWLIYLILFLLNFLIVFLSPVSSLQNRIKLLNVLFMDLINFMTNCYINTKGYYIGYYLYCISTISLYIHEHEISNLLHKCVTHVFFFIYYLMLYLSCKTQWLLWR